MKRLLFTLLLCTAAALAADISGTWKGTAEGPQGTLERTFVFKVDGAKLTGDTTSQMLGKSVINDGKVDGDNISFSITANLGGNDVKLTYKGKVTGNDGKLTSEFGGNDQKIEWTLKKQ